MIALVGGTISGLAPVSARLAIRKMAVERLYGINPN